LRTNRKEVRKRFKKEKKRKEKKRNPLHGLKPLKRDM
jgi:hypothetical protein